MYVIAFSISVFIYMFVRVKLNNVDHSKRKNKRGSFKYDGSEIV